MILRIAFVSLLSQVSAAFAMPPPMEGDTDTPACEDARILAQAMFESEAAYLYAPLMVPEAMESTLALGTSEVDISGGDALQSTDAFRKLPKPDGRSVYWAQGADSGKRIVVVERPVGWRGDMYSLYLLEEGLEQVAFMDDVARGELELAQEPLLSDAWRPPLVFRQPDEGLWFIDVGQPFDILADWRVYTPDATQPICTITFADASGELVEGLPEEVRKLADWLDQALGEEGQQGTLRPVARLRLHAQRVLANVTHRPWAVSEKDAYNTRQQVVAGLETWARGHGERLRLLQDMEDVYPDAERSLSRYYAHTLGLEGADELAARALDVLFRSYFVFPSLDRPSGTH